MALSGGQVVVELLEPSEFVAEETAGFGRPLGEREIVRAAVEPAPELIKPPRKGDDGRVGVGRGVFAWGRFWQYPRGEVGLTKRGGVGEIGHL